MRIAQVAPLYESVPPKYYGGTERVVSYLTEELVREGHEVILFASGDSVTKARLVAACRRSLRLDKHCIDQMAHQVVTLEVVFQRAEEFDVVHFHIDYLHFPLSRRQPITHVTTFHGRLDIPDLIPLYKEFRGMPVISISNGQREAAAKVLAGLLDASLFFDLHRLPELFCGFPRRPGESPTLYPVACAPQAWASGAVFLLLEACLGLSVLASERRVIFSKPLLPGFLRQVTIRDLKVGEARVDLLLTRHDEGDVGVNVLRRDGEVDIAVLK